MLDKKNIYREKIVWKIVIENTYFCKLLSKMICDNKNAEREKIPNDNIIIFI